MSIWHTKQRSEFQSEKGERKTAGRSQEDSENLKVESADPLELIPVPDM